MAKPKNKRTLKIRMTKRVPKPTTAKNPKALKIKMSKPTVRPGTLTQYLTMPEKAQDKWDRVGFVISKMRSDEISLNKASKEIGINQKTVLKLAGNALRKGSNGKYSVSKNERILRVLVMPVREGIGEVAVRGFKAAREIAKFDNAVQLYLRTGDDSKLKRFEKLKLKDASGKQIEFLTDTAELRRLGNAGVISFESLYRGGM